MYKVTIVKIEEKEVLKSVYVGDKSPTNYAEQLVKEKVSTEIYSQLKENLELKDLIRSINFTE